MTSRFWGFNAADNGRVHTNSGVSNKAFFLLVDGQTFNTYTVSPIGLGFLMASYGYAKDKVPNSSVLRRTFSIGYDYFLSKATDIYAVVMNERVSALSPANTVAAGVRLRF